MATPTVRVAAGSNSAAGTAGTVPTHTLGAGIQTGDQGFLLVCTNSDTVTTVAPTSQGGWTLVDGPQTIGAGTTALRAWLWKRASMAAADSSSAVTGFSANFATFRWAVASIVLAGSDSSNSPATLWTETTVDTTLAIPTATPTVNDSLLVPIVGLRYNGVGGTGMTPPAAYTEDVDTITTNGAGIKIGAWAAHDPLTGGAGSPQGGGNGTFGGIGGTNVGWQIVAAPPAAAVRPRPVLVVRQAVNRASVI